MVLRWCFAFTRKGLEDVFKEVLGTSSGRRLGDVFKEVVRTSSGGRLDDVLKTGRRDFHFRPIYDVFETKIKTFLRRLCDVIVLAEEIPRVCNAHF